MGSAPPFPKGNLSCLPQRALLRWVGPTFLYRHSGLCWFSHSETVVRNLAQYCGLEPILSTDTVDCAVSDTVALCWDCHLGTLRWVKPIFSTDTVALCWDCHLGTLRWVKPVFSTDTVKLCCLSTCLGGWYPKHWWQFQCLCELQENPTAIYYCKKYHNNLKMYYIIVQNNTE